MSSQRTTGLRAADWVAAGVLALIGLAMGLTAPPTIIPQPIVVLPLILVLIDVGLSAIVAAREHRDFNGILHFIFLLVFMGVLFVVSVLSGLKPELVVLLPLVVREVILIGKLF